MPVKLRPSRGLSWGLSWGRGEVPAGVRNVPSAEGVLPHGCTPGTGSTSRRAAGSSRGGKGEVGRLWGCSEGNQGRHGTKPEEGTDGAVVSHPPVLSPKANICHQMGASPSGVWALPEPRAQGAHTAGVSVQGPVVQGVCLVRGAHSAVCAWHRVRHCRVLSARVLTVRAQCRVRRGSAVPRAHGGGRWCCGEPMGQALLRPHSEAPDAAPDACTSLASCGSRAGVPAEE